MDLARIEIINEEEAEGAIRNDRTSRVPRIMTPECFSLALEQISLYTNQIILFGHGDPLLHPQFIELMNICYQQQMQVHVITDGIHRKGLPCLLFFPQIHELTFDLRRIDRERINYQEHIDAVLALCEAASGLNYPRCTILFSKTDVRRKPATSFMLNHIGQYGTPRFISDAAGFKIMENVYVRLEEDAEAQAGASAASACSSCREMITILSNGIVTPCGHDDEGHISLGNINIAPLKTILRSGRRTKMVRDFDQGIIREQYCMECRFRK